MKKRIYRILAPSERTGDLSWWFDVFMITLIGFNVLAIVLESYARLRQDYAVAFWVFELFSVAVFSIEYVLRIWTANEEPGYEKPVTGNIRYALTPLLIVDLLAVLPFFIGALGVDLRLLRIMRVFRLFRLFKTARYVVALSLINRVFLEKREELTIAFVFTLFMLLISATLMYYVENTAQPDKFSSIPETMWWGIATLTTVGYGDVYPITSLGRFLGGIISVFGIGIFALPAGILASGFSEELSKRRKHQECPHCGKEID